MRLALGVTVIAVVLLLLSCGTTTRCGPGACAGCCDATGACVDGTQSGACGTSGAMCSVCTGSCVAGQCVANTGGGSAGGTGGGTACANCRGCCDNGTCRAGNGLDACGSDGGVCVNCLSQNRVCVAGQCQTECTPATCAGCCRNNQCITATTVDACGRLGETCVRCQPGESCQAGLCGGGDGGMGQLDGGSACQRTCIGCCDLTDTCQVGTAATACGSMGNRCQVCNCNQSRSGGGRCT